MKKSLILCTGIVLLCAACQGNVVDYEALQPTGVHLQATFDIPRPSDGTQFVEDHMDYLLYLPEGYWDDEKEWPLILFLHGAGSGENDSVFMLSYGLPAVLYTQEQPENFEFIVVSPQAFADTPWWVDNQVTIIGLLLDEIIENYRVDEERVYVTGLSMGGYGSWYAAGTFPERFAAMASIAGSGFYLSYVPGTDVLCQLEEVPVWAIHGAEDQISDPLAVKMHVLALEECGGEVEWTLYPDAGHFETYDRAYRDPDLYAWMLAHTRTLEP